MSKKPMTSERAKDVIRAAADEWLQQFGSDDAIAQHTRRFLEQQREQVVPAVLGFSYRWNRWEVETVNGFNQYALISKAIDAVAQQAAIEWLKENLQSIRINNKEITQCARAAYREGTEDAIRKAAYRAGQRDAEQMIERVLAEMEGKP